MIRTFKCKDGLRLEDAVKGRGATSAEPEAIAMPTWVKGIDLSFSRAPREWWRARYQEGCRVAVQCLWTGGYSNNHRLRAVAGPNLEDAHNEGFTIAGYINANPWYRPADCLASAALNAGEIWQVLRVAPVDVEIEGTTEANIVGMCQAVQMTGRKAPIYSAAWFWRDHLGNPQWPWLREHKVWEAYYDGDPDVDFRARRFGPWELGDICGEQYHGTTMINGVDVDLNVFDLDYWKGDDVTLTDIQAKMLQTIYDRSKDVLVRVAGTQRIYAYSADGELIHITSPEVLAAAGYSFEEVLEYPATHLIWSVEARYPAGVPEELR